ncbi:MAG: DUF1634 domain-containing protein [Ferrovum sp.]|nr:DUF1634 domain-containing protein [Ferrovum sp.]
MTKHHYPPHEQMRYASVMHWVTLTGFVTLVVTFALYMSGIATAQVPLERLPQLWKLSAADYAAATGLPDGWSWVLALNKGDFLSLLGIAILSACPILSIASVVPVYLKEKNYIYVALCLMAVVVLLYAASGEVSVHHK